jgi:hypothetical protein
MKKIFSFACAFGLLPLAGLAGSRTSANYSIPADTADGGGRRATSAAYVNDGSIGGIAGSSTVAVPALAARQGYPAQLIDVTNIVISANPATINENSTRQLVARLAYDDGTVSPLAGGGVAWSVVNGPLSGINASGLATATNVYQDTPATVRGSSGGRSNTLGLIVINTGIDDFASYAADGINDAWQVLHFGLNNPNAGPGFDPDADGQTNFFEYVATTIPTDGNSRFRVGISNVVGQPIQKAVIFSPRDAARVYTVEGRPQVAGGTFLTITGIVNDAASIRTVTDTNAVTSDKFYRVKIEFP